MLAPQKSCDLHMCHSLSPQHALLMLALYVSSNIVPMVWGKQLPDGIETHFS